MAKYIEYGALIDKLKWDNDIQKWALRDDDFESLGAADVVPVVHARWVSFEKNYNGQQIYYVRCSRCGKERPFDYELRWCNFCGAKMGRVGK